MNNVWAIALVKNEVDIIRYTISHLIFEGIDGIIIQDNGSTDGTMEELVSLMPKSPIPMHVILEPKDSLYNQSQNMTKLAEVAAMYGATHIVPVDCDELWYSPLGKIGDVIKDSNKRLFHVEQYFHYSTAYDDETCWNPYKRMTFRKENPAPWVKVCFRYEEGDIIGSGNHSVLDINGDAVSVNPDHTSIKIRHFPIRSFQQMKSKILSNKNWGTNAPVQSFLYEYYRMNGEQGLKDVWNNGNLISDESGYRLIKDPGSFGLINDRAPYRGK